jgi:hypothetical protein
MRDVDIRPATAADVDALWAVLEPIIRSGETYALPADMQRDDALVYWLSSDHEVFVAVENGAVLGTYYLRANQKGAGSHVANCGYLVIGGRRRDLETSFAHCVRCRDSKCDLHHAPVHATGLFVWIDGR